MALAASPNFGAPAKSLPQDVRSTPVNTISRLPAATAARARASTRSNGKEREFPRP